MQRLKLFLPLIIFVIMAAIFFGVERRVQTGDYDPMALPSALVDRPLPSFSLPTLDGVQLSNAELPDTWFLVNVWATWCPSCHFEHPFLVELKEEGVAILGVDYKDKLVPAQRWLDEKGDPYFATLFDKVGTFGLDLGVTGAPETYLVDAEGIVRFRYQGALDRQIWDKVFAPRIAALQGTVEGGDSQ